MPTRFSENVCVFFRRDDSDFRSRLDLGGLASSSLRSGFVSLARFCVTRSLGGSGDGLFFRTLVVSCFGERWSGREFTPRRAATRCFWALALRCPFTPAAASRSCSRAEPRASTRAFGASAVCFLAPGGPGGVEGRAETRFFESGGSCVGLREQARFAQT